MQARPTSTALGEVPEVLFAGGVELGSLLVYNSHATDAVNLKIWGSRSTAPDPAADAAYLTFPCGPGWTVIPLFAMVPGASYVAATDELGLGATAPAADLVMTATYEPVRS